MINHPIQTKVFPTTFIIVTVLLSLWQSSNLAESLRIQINAGEFVYYNLSQLKYGNTIPNKESAEHLLKFDLENIHKYYLNLSRYQKRINIGKIINIHSDMSKKQTNQDYLNILKKVTLIGDGIQRADPLKDITLVHLVCVHNKEQQLRRMIKNMAHSEVAFIIFVDDKVNIETFLIELSDVMIKYKIFFVYPRIKIKWGCWSVAFMELILLTAGVKYFPQALYYSLRSGADYQIQPTEFILDFLRNEYPNDFINIVQDKVKRENMISWRIHYFHLANYSLAEAIRWVFPKREVLDLKYGYGSNWVTLSSFTSKKMVDTLYSRPEIMEFFEYTWVPDEFIFQTLYQQVYGFVMPKKCLIQTFWENYILHPDTLNKSHFNRLTRDPCIFWARKFDSEDLESVGLLDMIDLHIKKLSKSKKYRKCVA